MTGIKVAADMYRDHGRWYLHICAPEWIVKEWASEWHAGAKMGISNYGGEYMGNMLDLTIVLSPQEQLAHAAND